MNCIVYSTQYTVLSTLLYIVLYMTRSFLYYVF
jgi:hypothetical protein